ncbi:MAG: hypothetical protein LAP85_18405 [Acidobacteriia bacterium]|nr:hypothetical protein [Terriglobia bacterium]
MRTPALRNLLPISLGFAVSAVVATAVLLGMRLTLAYLPTGGWPLWVILALLYGFLGLSATAAYRRSKRVKLEQARVQELEKCFELQCLNRVRWEDSETLSDEILSKKFRSTQDWEEEARQLSAALSGIGARVEDKQKVTSEPAGRQQNGDRAKTDQSPSKLFERSGKQKEILPTLAHFEAPSPRRAFKSSSGFLQALAMTLAALMCLCSIPAFFIYLALSPEHYAKAIRISVLLVSTGIGTFYYLTRRERFPTVADKVTFFTGVVLGPVGVTEILL